MNSPPPSSTPNPNPSFPLSTPIDDSSNRPNPIKIGESDKERGLKLPVESGGSSGGHVATPLRSLDHDVASGSETVPGSGEVALSARPFSRSLKRRQTTLYGWSQMLHEVLDMILHYLRLPDCLSFGAVCVNWRFVFIQRLCCSDPMPCMLKLTPLHNLSRRQPLWAVHEDQLKRLPCSSPCFVSERILGSSKGWLVLTSMQNPGLYLYDPTTEDRISLPVMTSSGMMMRDHFENCFRPVCCEMSSSPRLPGCICMVMGYGESNHYLACSKNDSTNWIINLEEPLPRGFMTEEMIYHKQNLYILGVRGDIIVYKYDLELKLSRRGVITQNCQSGGFMKKLVKSGDELLLILWHTSENLEIFKLDGEWDDYWVEVEDLLDCALLIGLTTTVVVHVKDLMGSCFEKNCIYFYSFTSARALVKFSMADRSCHRISVPFVFDWILSSMDRTIGRQSSIMPTLNFTC